MPYMRAKGKPGSGAEFSECKTYRYSLWRRWRNWNRDVELASGFLAFVGLNPSTADEYRDDPTIRRCIRFAKDWGFDGLVMLNAYALRSTDPKKLKMVLDPVGKENDDAIERWSKRCKMVVAAWGNHCSSQREQAVLQAIDKPVHTLGFTKTGKPKHPLYIKASTIPQLYWEP